LLDGSPAITVTSADPDFSRIGAPLNVAEHIYYQ
jgi:hypothetical protein